MTKQGTNTIYDAIPMKYQKYPSTTILTHVNALDEASKSPYVRLYNMMPCKYVQYYNPRTSNDYIRH